MDFADVVWLSLGIWIVLMVAAIYFARRSNNKALALMRQIPDFSATWFHCDIGNLIAIDGERSAMALVNVSAPERQRARRFSHRDILSVEIIEDGASVTRINRSSQLGGALIGGLAFGGIGALAGALSGEKRTTQKVKNMELRILVNDPESPSFAINFMRSETTTGGVFHSAARNRAKEWQGRVEILIRKADQEDMANEHSAPISSLSQDLERLAALQKSGALTEEEFAAAKRSLLERKTGATM
jgi:hypothetical protein